MLKSEYPKIARTIAEQCTAGTPAAYEAFVERNLDNYEEPPDTDDFWSWFESGFDEIKPG